MSGFIDDDWMYFRAPRDMWAPYEPPHSCACPPEMTRIQLEDYYSDQLSDLAAAYEVKLASMPTYQLIVAEQARARRLHPDDHAGIADDDSNMVTLWNEVADVADEEGVENLALVRKLIQVASVATAWAERIIDDNDFIHDDILQLIEEEE